MQVLKFAFQKFKILEILNFRPCKQCVRSKHPCLKAGSNTILFIYCLLVIFQRISQNQERFIAMLNDQDEEPGQQGGGGGGTGGDPMGGGGGYIQVTPQEKEAIERVSIEAVLLYLCSIFGHLNSEKCCPQYQVRETHDLWRHICYSKGAAISEIIPICGQFLCFFLHNTKGVKANNGFVS